MTDLRIYNLIHKDLTGEISDSEKLELKTFENTSEYQSIYDDLESLWVGSKDYFPKKSFDVDAAKAKFRQNIKALPPEAKPNVATATKSNSNNWVYAIAAALILGLLGYATYHFTKSPYKDVNTTQTENQIEYAQLEDNSEVWLIPGSELSAESFAGSETRKLKLKGEAFFDVVPNAEQPFHIALGNGNHVEVLGTSFNVITDLGDGSAKVDVKEGSVRLYNEFNSSMSTILTAGESSVINPKTELLSKQHSSRIYSLLGTSLSFREAILTDVFNELSEVYNVDFQFDEDDYNSCQFNSPLLENMGVDEILEVINTQYNGLEIAKENDSKYVVSGKACD